MTRRFVRVALVCVGLLATAWFGYRVWQDEMGLAVLRQSAATLDRSSEAVQTTLADLRATLHAYVAPGQGSPFWIARAATEIDALRAGLLSLDGAVAAAGGGSLSGSLDGIDQIASAEKRARDFVNNEQPLMAGDVIFTDLRDLLDATGRQVAAARQVLLRASETHSAALRQEQATLAAGTVVLWVVLALVLVPLPRQVGALAPAQPVAEASETKTPEQVLTPVATVAAPDSAGASAALNNAAKICSDLSSLSDISALPAALAGVCDVLGATGVIVWAASSDGQTLAPVATHGFDARMVARIGTVPRDSANLTAKAFREGAARQSASTPSTPAALAVPMAGPSGLVGVLSVELLASHDLDEASVALATIFAAQLAELVSSPVAPEEASPASAAEIS